MNSRVREVLATQSETKIISVGATVTVGTAGGQIFLCAIPGGSNSRQRIGNRIRLAGIHLRLTLTSTLAAGGPAQAFRLIIYRRKSGPYAEWVDDNPLLNPLDPFGGAHVFAVVPRTRFSVQRDYLTTFGVQGEATASRDYNIHLRWPHGTGPVVSYTGVGENDGGFGGYYLGMVAHLGGLSGVVLIETFFKDI